MRLQKISKQMQKKTLWASGESTEIYLYPEYGDYGTRDFTWRVSTATVTEETSNFTALTGIKRWIMPLDAQMKLKHSNNLRSIFEITLKPFQPHGFRGDWDTTCLGKATDFNLMFKVGSHGLIKHLKLMRYEPKKLSQVFMEAFDSRLSGQHSRITIGIYSYDGTFTLEHEQIESSEMMLVHINTKEIDKAADLVLSNEDTDSVNIILTVVSYNN
ncbi:MAG: HutD family protein [Bacillota bacterium]|nr:HutD family protein [Bacillota bacterium]